MREIIMESCLGYIRGCLSKGVELESWKLVQTNGLVWIENQKIGVRIRNKTAYDHFPAEANEGKEPNFQEKLTPNEDRFNLSVLRIQAEEPGETAHFKAVNNLRRGGLVGCDRAGTW